MIVIAGLTCGQMKNTHFTDYIAYLSGQTTKPVRVSFRCKSMDRPESLFSFQFTGKDGMETDIPWNKGISDVWSNRAFTLPACNYCDDIFAECADITFMDAWLREYSTDPRGTSFWIALTSRSPEILTRGKEAKEIVTNSVNIDSVIASQMGVVKEKRDMLSYRLSLSDGITKRVSPDPTAGSAIDRHMCRKNFGLPNSAWEPLYHLPRIWKN